MRVGIIGCGPVGQKRAVSLGHDELVGCCDVQEARASQVAEEVGGQAFTDADELLNLEPDVVVVAVPHDQLAELTCRALEAGAHVLVEKPVGLGVRDVDSVAIAAAAAGRRVKVGFNHRFHPAIARAVSEAHSGRFGEVMFARARYGHGGRLGYEREWRMQPEHSGGGELLDQGMHLLDILHWLMGPLPLHSALLRTQFWEARVEDNAVVVLGDSATPGARWATFHVTWTEWKNLFSLEIYCQTGKLQVDGLAKSYGQQSLTIYTMTQEMGPPDIERVQYPPEDTSWAAEWRHLRGVLANRDGSRLLGDLDSARYAWECVERAYSEAGYPLSSA